MYSTSSASTFYIPGMKASEVVGLPAPLPAGLSVTNRQLLCAYLGERQRTASEDCAHFLQAGPQPVGSTLPRYGNLQDGQARPVDVQDWLQ